MKVLMIQRRALGDALFTSLVGKVLKKEFENVKVGFLTLKPLCEILEKFDFIDECFGYEGFVSTLRRIRKFSPDVVLDYEATARTYLLVLLSGAEKRIAFYGKRREKYLYPIYTDIVKKEDFGYTFWDRLKLLSPLGINYRAYINTFIPLEVRNREDSYIVFVPKGKIRTKEISPSVVANIKKKVEEGLGIDVKVFVEPKEGEYINRLRREGVEPMSVSLKEFYEFVKNSKGVLCVEGFPQHLALLLGKRVLTIVQSMRPWFREDFGRLYYYYPELECVGCGRKSCPKGSYECSFRIDVNKVVELLGKYVVLK